LLDSPEFRTALPTKRYPTGLAVIASSEHNSASESVIQQAASRASTEVDRRVLALEISLKPHMEQLAEELRKTTIWRAATSIPKRHAAAIDFLIGKAEGYRLSSRITDPLMRAAKEPDDGNIVFMAAKQLCQTQPTIGRRNGVFPAEGSCGKRQTCGTGPEPRQTRQAGGCQPEAASQPGKSRTSGTRERVAAKSAR
jgi:hypothetical protein